MTATALGLDLAQRTRGDFPVLDQQIHGRNRQQESLMDSTQHISSSKTPIFRLCWTLGMEQG